MGGIPQLKDSLERIKRVFGKNLVSVILCGSGATDETCWVKKEDNKEYMSDLDLIVVTRIYSPFYHKILKNIEDLSELPLSLDFLPIFRLKKHKTLMAYKVKHSGKILHGNSEILNKIPISSSSELPYWEGIRLLFNEGVQSLNVSIFEKGIKKTFYCLKSVESCMEAALLFEKKHELSYRSRLNRFSKTKFSYKLPKDQMIEIAKLRFNHKRNQWKYSDSVWPFCKELVLDMLSFHLSKYLGVKGPLEEKLDFLVKQKRKPFRSDLVSWAKLFSLKKIILNPICRNSYSLNNLREATILLKNYDKKREKDSEIRRNLLFWRNLINYVEV